MTRRNTQTVPERTTSEISGELRRLAAEENDVLRSGGFKPIPYQNRETIIRALKASGSLMGIYAEALRFYITPDSNNKYLQFGNSLAGRLYQEIAYGVLAGVQTPHRILLSPRRTFKFYRTLYPAAPLMKHNFGMDSLSGISVPDGIIVDGDEGHGHILTVCEYTVADSLTYEGEYKKKYTGFQKGKKHFPEILNTANLLFVVPEYTQLPLPMGNGVEKMELPFTRVQYKNIFDWFDKIYRPNEDSATLAEIQIFARDQLQRGEEYRRTGRITPQFDAYMRRFSGGSATR